MLFMLEKLIAEAFCTNQGDIPTSVHGGLSTDTLNRGVLQNAMVCVVVLEDGDNKKPRGMRGFFAVRERY